MKKLGFLFALVIVFGSCEPEHPKDYLSFSGVVQNYKDSILYIAGEDLKKQIKVNEDGSFQDSLKVPKADLYTLFAPRTGRAYIHLANGYDLQLSGDGDQFFTSFKYDGSKEAADSNNLLIDQYNLGQTAGNAEGFLLLEKEDFQKKVDQYRKGMDSIVELYPNANSDLIEKLAKQNEDFYSYMESNYDEIHPALIARKEAMARLAKGKPAPEFHDYENFAGGTNSLKDFKGKFVYIDIWATWCGPCFAQFPYLKELEKDFEGKNISFVSISTDDDRRSGTWENAHEKWIKTVKSQNLSGIQLWAGKDDARFSQEYQISKIPRFILIDPEGKIVNSDEMRPSSPNIREYLTSVGVK